MSDYLQGLVDKTVLEVQKGPSKEVLESFAVLADLDPNALLPELFLQVEEASNSVDLDAIQPTQLVPDVNFARGVIDAVLAQDSEALKQVIDGGYPDLVVALVAVIAALKPSVEEHASESDATPLEHAVIE